MLHSEAIACFFLIDVEFLHGGLEVRRWIYVRFFVGVASEDVGAPIHEVVLKSLRWLRLNGKETLSFSVDLERKN